MEKEIMETYHFNPADFVDGKKRDGTTFRDVVKDFERDFHRKHNGNYAYNLYANASTMRLLEQGNGAASFLSYGMELTQGTSFCPVADPQANHEIDKHSEYVMVYGIDSAFMDQYDEDGDPIFGEKNDIYPLTLLIDNSMRDGTIRLATPTIDDDEEEEVPELIDSPKYEFV